MISRFTFFAVLAFCCLSFSAAYSQTDSTHFDLGGLQIDKHLTQNITIKAADLEKFPTANLADALKVWLYGTYTATVSVFYVVDGNITSDIRLYSIYDIEEVTFIQSAATQISGASTTQQLVLIKTKRNRSGKSGIVGAAQTNLVNLRNSSITPAGSTSTTNFYHQYYVSGYKNYDNINLGMSASYLRDVTPMLKDPAYTYDIKRPLNNNILRFNGYTDVKLGRDNTLNATIAYSPETNKLNYTNDIYTPDKGQGSSQTQSDINNLTNQHLLNASLQLNSQIINGLHNKLLISYSHLGYSKKNLTYVTNNYNNIYTSHSKAKDSIIDRQTTYLINDNLSYQKRLGNFSFEPAVNFTYRYSQDSSFYNSSTLAYMDNESSFSSSSLSKSITYTTGKIYFLTPSLNLSYKNGINIQGGVLMILNSKQHLDIQDQKAIKRIFPFITTSIDIAKLTNLDGAGIRLFGSFARQNATIELNPTQTSVYTFNVDDYGYPGYFIPSTAVDQLKPHSIYKGGAIFEISQVVSINYNYEHGAALIPATYSSISQNIPEIISGQFNLNRIGLNINLVNTSAIHYLINLNATNNKQTIVLGTTSSILGSGLWTGAWVNRLDYKNIFAGLDVLYQTGSIGTLNSNIMLNALVTGQNTNSLSLQNLYFGYRLKTILFNNLELYANGRNIWQNKKSDITDNRRFYGAGLRVGF